MASFLWKNAQWKVYSNGIDTVDKKHSYFIEIDRLLEEYHDGLYEWPIHMAKKPWVDLDMFIDAWLTGLAYAFKLEEDPVIVAKSIIEAYKLRGEMVGRHTLEMYMYPPVDDGIELLSAAQLSERHRAVSKALNYEGTRNFYPDGPPKYKDPRSLK